MNENRPGKMARPEAFTLIELLIVVAIIAILAAIAVPNFLEAQTRSKVSRAKSDLRTLNLAFQAYYTDYMKMPPDGNDPTITGYSWNWSMESNVLPDLLSRGGAQWEFHAYRYYSPLTSPVAYVTSVPHDAFSAFMPYAYDWLGGDGYCMCASAGPDRTACDWLRFNWADAMARPYDPSNGTKSIGDIWRPMIVRYKELWDQWYPFEYD